MTRTTGLAAAALALSTFAAAPFLACSSSTSTHEFDQTTPDAGAADGQTIGEGGNIVAPANGHLTGKVFAPEGTIPISGALVYVSATKPDPIPDGVFCDKCVQLESSTPYATTNPDGSFDIKSQTGKHFLVVQKGNFRRVREIDIKDGDNALGKDVTSLPRKSDKALGDDIPKMAVISGIYDPIEASLAKLGLGDVDSSGAYVDGSGSFDMYEGGASGTSGEACLLEDAKKLNSYQIVFRPCSECSDGYSSKSLPIKNVQDFVSAGGRFYVTDWSYEWVRQPWPQYMTFVGTGTGFGGACDASTEYEAKADVKDDGLNNWLKAQNISNFQVEANWIVIDKLNTVQTTDPDGKPISVTPKVWVEGNTGTAGVKPTTVSFEKGCGRVLYSTYHTEATGTSKLSPQELALLYVLLEVNVCIGTTKVN
jgi:hypothetical protein